MNGFTATLWLRGFLRMQMTTPRATKARERTLPTTPPISGAFDFRRLSATLVLDVALDAGLDTELDEEI